MPVEELELLWPLSMELRQKLPIHEQQNISVGNLSVSKLPSTLFGGMNVLESRELALEVAPHTKNNW